MLHEQDLARAWPLHRLVIDGWNGVTWQTKSTGGIEKTVVRLLNEIKGGTSLVGHLLLADRAAGKAIGKAFAMGLIKDIEFKRGFGLRLECVEPNASEYIAAHDNGQEWLF